MGSKISNFFLILVIILMVSCRSEPKTIPETSLSQSDKTETTVQQIEEEIFDPRTVSVAQHDSTLDEVQHFIGNLNDIISKKNYNAWKTKLSQKYFKEISSSQFLKQISDSPALKTRKIVLKTPEDYFTNVVVPSRANSRVDDIEFIGTNRVKAFSIIKNRAGEEQRLVLYDLEKVGNSWLIVN
jgi:phage/plasmid-associated DNA primase